MSYTVLDQRLEQMETEIERLRAAIDRKDAALHRSLKFIRLGNHPNAGDLIEQIYQALEKSPQ